MKKVKFHSEIIYVAAILILSLSVAMIAATDFGVSLNAPAYLLSMKVPFLSLGQSEYIVQAILFTLFCILMKKVKFMYFVSFLTGILYASAIDFWRVVIPHFNPEITAPGSLSIGLRIAYFILGMVLTSFSVALFFKTYLYPGIYDFFVKGVSEKYSLHTGKFKIGFDVSIFLISLAMSLIMFRGILAIGIGTIVSTVCNGFIITAFSKMLDKKVIIEPKFEKLSKKFELA